MAGENQELKIVSAEELSYVKNSALEPQQLNWLLKATPKKYIKQRPAKGGGQWDYVSGGYVKKCLNLMFGWNWSFEITEQLIMHGEAIVKGRLTVVSNGNTITKMQFGNKDIMYKKQSDAEKVANTEKIPLSIGNDLKSAATDCLKKCAAELGIAADIYNKEEFSAIEVVEGYDWDALEELFEAKQELLKEEELLGAKRIINKKEASSYQKLFNKLKSL